jgi:hypothetical protein
MRYKYYILLLLFIPFYSSSQKVNLKGRIYDFTTKSPIPFASIQIKKQKLFLDTDQNGNYNIDLDLKDSVVISCVGYYDIVLSVNKVIDKDSIFLKEKFEELEAVTVINKQSNIVGIIDEKQQRSHFGENGSDRYEMGTLIESHLSSRPYRINKILVKQKNFNFDAPFQIHLYSVNKQNMPDKELLKNQIIVANPNIVDGKIVVDIKNQNLIYDEGSFFISIQFLTSIKVNAKKGIDYGIGETYKIDKPLTYRRLLYLENYRWFNEYENCVVFPSNDMEIEKIIFWDGRKNKNFGRPINMLVSAEIQEL